MAFSRLDGGTHRSINNLYNMGVIGECRVLVRKSLYILSDSINARFDKVLLRNTLFFFKALRTGLET